MSGPDLAAALGVSRRTIQNDIKRINQEYAIDDAPIESNRRLGYRLRTADSETLENVPQRSIREAQTSHPGVPNFIERQMLAVLLWESDYVTLETLANRLYVSRLTVVAHFERVKRIVPRTEGARLVTSSGRGVRIEAPERIKRVLLMKSGGTDVGRAVYSDADARRISAEGARLHHLVADLFITYGVMATSDAFESFVRYLIVSIERSRQGFTLDDAAGKEPDRVICDLARRIRAVCGYSFAASELIKIGQVFRELNLIRSNVPTDAEVDELLDAFEDRFEELFGVRLDMTRDLRQALGSHVARLGKRLEAGRPNVGNHTGRLFTTYPLAVHALKICLEPVLGMAIPDAEISYMVQYLAVAVERLRDKLQILLVSDRNAASIFDLERRLKFFADEAQGIIRTVPTYMYRANAEVYSAWAHVLITTEPETALLDARFMLVDDEHSRRQLDAVRAEVMAHRAAMTSDELSEMRERFPVHVLSDAQAADAVETLFVEDTGICRSAETVGPSTLCIVQNSQESESSMSVGEFERPIRYGGKRIERLIFANYAGEAGVVAFFSRLRELISEHTVSRSGQDAST